MQTPSRIDPNKACRIAQEVFNALGAPEDASGISFDTLRSKKSLKDAFARWAPLYGVHRAMPDFRNGHWAAGYRAYLEETERIVKSYISQRNGKRFTEQEKTLLSGEPISNERQVALL